MINLASNSLKIQLAIEPVDLRKSFDGLDGLATMLRQQDDYQQYLWLFTNKRFNRLKLLYYDRSGVWVAAKRLEQGTFSWPPPSQAGQQTVSLAGEAVQLLLDGVDLRDASLRPWYENQKK